MNDTTTSQPAVRVGKAFTRATFIAAVLIAGWMFVSTYRDMFQTIPSGSAGESDTPVDDSLAAPGEWSFSLANWDVVYRTTTSEEWNQAEQANVAHVAHVGPKADFETKLLKAAKSLGKPRQVDSATVYEGPLGKMAWASARVETHNGEERLVHARAAWKTGNVDEGVAVIELRPAASATRSASEGLMPLPTGVNVVATRASKEATQLQMVGPVADRAALEAHWRAAGWTRTEIEPNAPTTWSNGSKNVTVMQWDGPTTLGAFLVLVPKQPQSAASK